MSHSDDTSPFFSAQSERERRWRLVLGQLEQSEDEEQGSEGQQGQAGEPGGSGLSPGDQKLDSLLEDLYGDSEEGDLSDADPDIARWLGDIRTYFPDSTVRLLQQDALDKLNLRKLLRDPAWLAEIEPDMALVNKLLSLRKVMPPETRETARELVQQLVDDLVRQLTYAMQQALRGSLNRSRRTRRPKYREINWLRTIHANLRHYQPAQRTVVPERLVGYGRQQSSLRDVILCIDQSGSMMSSMVYASIFGAVMASLPALKTRLVLFSTAVADVTDQIDDPVEILFGVQLRGGTNIDRALAYCQQLVSRPQDTILVLISDLFEGGDKESMVQRVAALVDSGVQVIVLLALNDKGTPRFNRDIGRQLLEIGVPSFACTPDLFPDLMAAVINGRDLSQWAAAHNIVTTPNN